MTADRNIAGLLLALRLTLPLTSSRKGGVAAQPPMPPAADFDPDWITGKLEYEEDGHEPALRRHDHGPHRWTRRAEASCTGRR